MNIHTESETITTLHLDESEFSSLIAIMRHVQLGQNTVLSNLAFELLKHYEDEFGDCDHLEGCVEYFNYETEEEFDDVSIREVE